MDKKLKAKWLKALRSRKFKQGTGALCSGDGRYCCLGVLCEVAKLPKKKDEGNMSIYWSDESLTDRSTTQIPTNFRDVARIDAATQSTLIHMNDSEYKKFWQIAKWIEKNL